MRQTDGNRGRATRLRLPDLGPRGEGWVVLQGVLFLGIAGAGLLGPQWGGAARLVGAIAGAAMIVAGIGLAGAGILWLRHQLTVYPRPIPGGRLIEDGPFGLVRHPIYGGLVLMAAGWGLATASLAALAGAAVLAAFFDLKSRREEAWLDERFAGYAAYRRRTRRLLPWLY